MQAHLQHAPQPVPPGGTAQLAAHARCLLPWMPRCWSVQELRRGSEQATIYCLTLSQHCEWLAVCSDKGTVHVFACSPAVRTGGGDGSGAAGAGGGGVPGGGGPGVVAAAANDGAAGCAVGVRSNPTSMFGLVKVCCLGGTPRAGASVRASRATTMCWGLQASRLLATCARRWHCCRASAVESLSRSGGA